MLVSTVGTCSYVRYAIFWEIASGIISVFSALGSTVDTCTLRQSSEAV